MSRGFGKYQRLILAKLAVDGSFYLSDVLPLVHTLKEYQSLNRAARVLGEKGKIRLFVWSFGSKRIYVQPAGTVGQPLRPSSHLAEGVKCIKSTTKSPTRHLTPGREPKHWALPKPEDGEIGKCIDTFIKKGIIQLAPSEYRVKELAKQTTGDD